MESTDTIVYKYNKIFYKISQILSIPFRIWFKHWPLPCFFSTFVAARPNENYHIKKLLSFEIPSSTEWGINNKFVPNYFVDIQKYQKKKFLLLDQYRLEMKKPPHPRSVVNINALSIYRGGIVGLKHAEAFYVNKIIN